MIDKFKRMLERWLNTTPKETYIKLLEQFDQPNSGMVELPMMLHEFWLRVDPKHFQHGPGIREMMYINIDCNHDSIPQLKFLVNMVTNALIYEDDKAIIELATDQFIIKKQKTLDDYFLNQRGETIAFHAGVEEIKRIMDYHYRYLETAQSQHHCRVFNKMYNDILTVTRLIITNMPDSKDASGYNG